MRHTVPVSATFNVFNYINITPSLNITDRMYCVRCATLKVVDRLHFVPGKR